MKNFPHQFNDLTKLFNALIIAKRLIDNNIPLTDENFGEQLTREEIYTYRDKSLSIDEYIKSEKRKPASNRGYLTVSRDIRRFFELLGFITILQNKKGIINPIASDLLNSQSEEIKKQIWRRSMVSLKLEGLDGEVSHPYQILLKLVNFFPNGIKTAKLMLALEAENDTVEEFNKICHLAEQEISDIIKYTGTTESMAANAVKILPGIAQQLADIRREGDMTYPLNTRQNERLELLDSTINSTDNDFEIEDEDEEFLEPFDPEKISIDTKGITMDTCLRRLEQGTIILAPKFQRREVWPIEKKSRLIESLMLRIPIPMFYVSSDEQGIFSVVDGLQRLSTIRSFILGDDYLRSEPKNSSLRGNGFRLEGLEFWGDKYEDNNFNQLPINIQNRILETEFTFTIINPGTPEEVKRNIFKRINTGGEPLTAQEIRHALYVGNATDILYNLASKSEFLEAINFSAPRIRMEDREYVLRFLAFTIRSYTSYINNNMDTFLSDTMRIINLLPDLNGKPAAKIFPNSEAKKEVLIRDTVKLEELFLIAMKRAKEIFGRHAFRKSYGEKNRSPINKSLFEVWSVLLAKLTEPQFHKLRANKTKFLLEYSSRLEENEFINTISRNSSKYLSVQFRFETLQTLLNKYSND